MIVVYPVRARLLLICLNGHILCLSRPYYTRSPIRKIKTKPYGWTIIFEQRIWRPLFVCL
nr:MAG TPA: hypothetical protein [Caudoviricetes sp.]